MKLLVLAIGVTVICIGIVLGSHALTVSSASQTVGCGTAFIPQAADGHTADIRNMVVGTGLSDFGTRCEQIADKWQLFTWGTMAVGVVILVAAVLVKPRRTTH